MHRKPERVIETTLPGELILLDPASGMFCSLNDTGQFVWDRLDGRSHACIARDLARTFALAPERAAADVQKFVVELVNVGMMEETHDRCH